jgi:protein required for attachment to host cells
MEKTWVLIANSARAHCFERHGVDHALTKLMDFAHPHERLSARIGEGDLTGAAGKGHGRTAHAGTQFEPHTEAHAKERAIFSREIADYINDGVATQRCTSLVLIATSAMLGELRSCLSAASKKLVRSSVVSDLTSYEGPELKSRVEDALRLPDGSA